MFVDDVNQTDSHSEDLEKSNNDHYNVLWGSFIDNFLDMWQMCNQRSEKEGLLVC